MSGKIAIVVALQREIAPLVRGWRSSEIAAGNRNIKVFERGQALVACGGIGGNPARSATDAVYRYAKGNIAEFVSAGFAGALAPELKVGDIFEPATIVGDADNNTIELQGGRGTLVSAGAIAGVEHKRIFAEKYGAQAIDMEAFSVADVARIYNVRCRVLKAISDEYDFAMPPMGRFVTDEGEFQTGRFVAYAAVRPWTWSTVIRLGSNSAKASASLCEALSGAIAEFERRNTIVKVTV